MKEFKYTITDAQGIHARPAGLFIKLAAEYPCKITLEKAGREVDAKRILGVMSLGARQGDVITVRADGDKEAEAVAAIEEFLRENL